MANAIKKISVQRGYDVTRYALNCFGGAGGQHACLVADALGMTEVLIHPFSSLLSAYGMGLADIRATRQHAIEENLGAKALAAHQARGRTPRQGRQGRGRGPGRARGADQGDRPRACPLRRHRHAAGGRGRHAGQDEVRLREGAQGAVRLHRPRQATGGRGGVGRGGRRRRQVPRAQAQDHANEAPLARPARTKFFSNGTMAQGRGLHPRAAFARPQGQRPRHHHRAAPDHRARRRLAGRDHREEPSRAEARRRAPAHQGGRHQGRPDHARGVQQPVHVDRRADGRVAAEHRLFGQHQGAARLLLRGVLGRRLARRQRAAHAGASRLDGPRGRDHHPREQGQNPAGQFLSDQRALQRRHPHPRPHRLHADVRHAPRRRSCSGSPRAAITPTSAASRRARCRRSPPTSKRKASTSTTSSWSIAASSAKPRSTSFSPRRNIRRAIRCRTSTT